jgi:cytidyltransferase-like protein
LTQKIVIVSGYFNPLHKGHLEYFIQAKSLGDQLFVIVNNDAQRLLKGSKAFQDEQERQFIVSQLKMVDRVVLALDQDRSVCLTLRSISEQYGAGNSLFFANGGDQFNQSIPESEICRQLNIQLVDGLGSKIQSSSWLLKQEE